MHQKIATKRVKTIFSRRLRKNFRAFGAYRLVPNPPMDVIITYFSYNLYHSLQYARVPLQHLARRLKRLMKIDATLLRLALFV